jgi:Flp pilus assembly protein protease CpaA
MNFDFLSFFYYPIIFYIGIITSIEDWRTRKIKNKVLINGFLAGFFVFIFLIVWSLLIDPNSFFYVDIAEHVSIPNFFLQSVNPEFFIKTISNSFVAIVLGFLMWKYRIMAAGDAKLFALFAWLIPTSNYWRSYLTVFPAFALLVNIFFVVLIAFILRSFLFVCGNFHLVFNGKKYSDLLQSMKKKISIEYAKKIKNNLWVFYLIIFIFLFLQNINQYLGFSPSGNFGVYQGYLMVFFIVFRSQIVDVLKKKYISKVFFILLAINLLLSFVNSPAKLFLYLFHVSLIMICFLLVFDLMAKTMNFYLKNSAVRQIPIDNLRAGEIISDTLVEQLKAEKIIFHNYVGRIFPRGLDENEISTIKEWAKTKNKTEIGVYEHFPFAFWIFVGVIGTLIFKGSIFNIILNNI